MITTKNTRIEARVSSKQKDLFQRAASAQGRSLSDFVVDAVQKHAERVLRDREVMQLSEADRQVFVKAMLNPPKPNAALKRAHASYRKSSRG